MKTITYLTVTIFALVLSVVNAKETSGTEEFENKVTALENVATSIVQRYENVRVNQTSSATTEMIKMLNEIRTFREDVTNEQVELQNHLTNINWIEFEDRMDIETMLIRIRVLKETIESIAGEILIHLNNLDAGVIPQRHFSNDLDLKMNFIIARNLRQSVYFRDVNDLIGNFTISYVEGGNTTAMRDQVIDELSILADTSRSTFQQLVVAYSEDQQQVLYERDQKLEIAQIYQVESIIEQMIAVTRFTEKYLEDFKQFYT